MATTYDQQQQGSANKDLAQKNEAKVPAGQGTEVVNVAHGNIANTFAKAESEKTNKQGQSNDPYSTFNYYHSTGKLGGCFFGKVNDKFIKDMTIDELQKLSPAKGSNVKFKISYTDGDPDKNVTGRLFALGRYQIIPGTLKGLLAKPTLTKNSITKDSKFSEQVQDLCYSSFIKDVRKSVGQYLENKTVTDQLLDAAALELAKEWASIGIKPGVKNSKNRIGAKNGLTSYYSGDGLNNAHISYNQIVAALKADREAVQSGRMAIQTTASGLAAQGASKATGAADNTAKADTASDKAAATPTSTQKQDEKPASTPAPTTAINIDVQAAITFNKRVNAGRVEAIQTLVETKADGDIGPNTVNKIAEWQQKHNLTPDGKFGSGSLEYAIKNCGFKDPLASGGNTNTGTTNANSGTKSPATGTSHTLGSNSPTWCTNNGFINSKKLEDLKGNFKTVATDVIGGLRTAGASITVTATFRHPMRAATMYYARYYNENKTKANKAQEVFKQYGISMSATAAGAKAALSAFGVANGGKAPVGLYSNHREGHAVDMKITKLPASFKAGGVTIKTGGNKGGVTSNAQALNNAIKNSSSNIKDSFKWYGASDNVHWSLTGR